MHQKFLILLRGGNSTVDATLDSLTQPEKFNLTFSSGVVTGFGSCHLNGKMVTILGFYSGSIADNKTTIATVPAKYRSSTSHTGIGNINTSQNIGTPAIYNLDSSGNITQQITTGVSTSGTFTFFLSNILNIERI